MDTGSLQCGVPIAIEVVEVTTFGRRDYIRRARVAVYYSLAEPFAARVTHALKDSTRRRSVRAAAGNQCPSA